MKIESKIKCIMLLFIITSVSISSFSQETGDVTNVVTIDKLPENSIYHRIWQPYIARLGEDHYVAAYGLQLRGKTDMGDMFCSITKDGGGNMVASHKDL